MRIGDGIAFEGEPFASAYCLVETEPKLSDGLAPNSKSNETSNVKQVRETDDNAVLKPNLINNINASEPQFSTYKPEAMNAEGGYCSKCGSRLRVQDGRQSCINEQCPACGTYIPLPGATF